jgi:hypothetical protein
MPNWVRNEIHITGPENILESFKNQAAAPRPTKVTEPIIDKDGNPDWNNTVKVIKWIDNEPLCMWNFEYPDNDIIDEYFGDDEDSPNHWYNWNLEHWGSKWDVSDAELEESKYLGDTFLHYTFNTPWSPPITWFYILAKDYPELAFKIFYEEEQGWGGNFEIVNGQLIETNSWGIPSSHDDYRERENEDGCICSWEDDEQYWFQDCPREEKEGETK